MHYVHLCLCKHCACTGDPVYFWKPTTAKVLGKSGLTIYGALAMSYRWLIVDTMAGALITVITTKMYQFSATVSVGNYHDFNCVNFCLNCIL